MLPPPPLMLAQEVLRLRFLLGSGILMCSLWREVPPGDNIRISCGPC